MQLITHIEATPKFAIPQFKHPLKILHNGVDKTNNQYFSDHVSIPDGSIFHVCQNDDGAQCFLLFGYQIQMRDWQILLKQHPNLFYVVKLYKGKQVIEISSNHQNNKCFTKSKKVIHEPRQSLMKSTNSPKQPCSQMYTVQISAQKQGSPSKIIYYLPSIFDKNSPQLVLECIQARYFNNKMLQIVSEYVSLDSKSTVCFKDMAHHDFEAVVYGGKVSAFKIFCKMQQETNSHDVSQSFMEKLSEISLTDKHLLDEVEPLDFTQIKKEIRQLHLEHKRIRSSLTLQKMQIIDEIDKVLEFLNLKQFYPQKLTYHSITNDMLKKIKLQNIDNKAQWIKEQKYIITNLDSRIADLESMKIRLKDQLVALQKNNNEEIQSIRKEIKQLETGIRYEEADKASKVFKNKTNLRANSKSKSSNQTIDTATLGKTAYDILDKKRELDELQKSKILRYEMIKAEFEMQKEFMRKKAEYGKAAEEIFNYIIDC